jgi:type IV pilus biogenesis protein CpaD/CtpE
MSDPQAQRLTQAARNVIDAREQHPGSTLATLYDPLLTPPPLLTAHAELDSIVDSLFTKRRLTTSSDRLEVLLSRYQELTADDLFSSIQAPKRKKSRTVEA